VSKIREREFGNCFYTCSLNHIAISSLPRQPKPGFHYFRKFYKTQTKITLLNNRNIKIFDSNKNLNHIIVRNTLTDLESHQKHNQRHKNYKS